jgi:hypothetical protein
MLPTSKTNKTPGLVEQKGSPGNWRAILLPPHAKGRLNAYEALSKGNLW